MSHKGFATIYHNDLSVGLIYCLSYLFKQLTLSSRTARTGPDGHTVSEIKINKGYVRYYQFPSFGSFDPS